MVCNIYTVFHVYLSSNDALLRVQIAKKLSEHAPRMLKPRERVPERRQFQKSVNQQLLIPSLSLAVTTP